MSLRDFQYLAHLTELCQGYISLLSYDRLRDIVISGKAITKIAEDFNKTVDNLFQKDFTEIRNKLIKEMRHVQLLNDYAEEESDFRAANNNGTRFEDFAKNRLAEIKKEQYLLNVDLFKLKQQVVNESDQENHEYRINSVKQKLIILEMDLEKIKSWGIPLTEQERSIRAAQRKERAKFQSTSDHEIYSYLTSSNGLKLSQQIQDMQQKLNQLKQEILAKVEPNIYHHFLETLQKELLKSSQEGGTVITFPTFYQSALKEIVNLQLQYLAIKKESVSLENHEKDALKVKEDLEKQIAKLTKLDPKTEQEILSLKNMNTKLFQQKDAIESKIAQIRSKENHSGNIQSGLLSGAVSLIFIIGGFMAPPMALLPSISVCLVIAISTIWSLCSFGSAILTQLEMSTEWDEITNLERELLINSIKISQHIPKPLALNEKLKEAGKAYNEISNRLNEKRHLSALLSAKVSNVQPISLSSTQVFAAKQSTNTLAQNPLHENVNIQLG